MSKSIYSFSTNRLLIREWHHLNPKDWIQQDLSKVVKKILSERVTQSLPPNWQGPFSLDRAKKWVQERDEEGVTLLVIERESRMPIGLIILFEDSPESKKLSLRLGYILDEKVWGKGIATELIRGFIQWCKANNIKTIIAGVNRSNIASRRVLEKCGFILKNDSGEPDEQIFEMQFD